MTKQQFLDAMQIIQGMKVLGNSQPVLSTWLTDWSMDLIAASTVQSDQNIMHLFLNDLNNHLIKTERNGAA